MSGPTRDKIAAAIAVVNAKGGNVTEAARELGMKRRTLGDWIEMAKTGRLPEPKATITIAAAPDKAAVEDRIFELEHQLKAVKANTINEEYVKRKILGITAEMDKIVIPDWTLKPIKAADLPGVPTCFWSDWHAGERVFPTQLGGVNEYDMAIMRTRVSTLVHRTIRLLREYTVNPQYPGIVIPLGGDMLSGDIHEELSESNEAPMMKILLELYEVLLWALTKLADEFGRVFVPCVAGNHGRNTKKPRAKNRAFTNFDWLLYQFLRRGLAHDTRIVFYVPDGSDAWFRIYNHRYLMTHGDQFRGGDGQIGALGPMTRGNKKKMARNSAIGLEYDTMIMGHWHQYIPLLDQITNGSLKGYDEYASQGNFGFQLPIQALWMTHPKFGITQQWPIYLEDPATVAENQGEWVAFRDAA